MSKKRKSEGNAKFSRISIALYLFALANEHWEAVIGTKVKISGINLAYYRFACANKKEAQIGRKSEKWTGTNLAYYCFGYANEQEAEINRKSENQPDKSCLFPFYVRKWERSGKQEKKRKSAGEKSENQQDKSFLPITFLRSVWKTVISITDMGFSMDHLDGSQSKLRTLRCCSN